MKNLFNSKLKTTLSLSFILVLCAAVFFISSTFLGSNPSTPAHSAYSIGETVVDLGGSVWRFQGNFIIELGQITKDLRLLSVFINGVEKRVHWIGEELIPNVKIGDAFMLITPSDQLASQIRTNGPGPSDNPAKLINIIVYDPPASEFTYGGGTVCCLKIDP